MDRTTLTRDQAQAVSQVIRVQLGYLFKLRERMRAAGFPHDDPLLAKVDAAYDAVHRLSVDLHYLSCGMGAPLAHGHDSPAGKAGEGKAGEVEAG